EEGVLIQAHIRDARALVIATSETVQVRSMVEIARTLNPGVNVIVRSHNEEEADLLERDGAGKVFVGERELAQSMVGSVLSLVKMRA
ncbi:NAD-binding protein, partial [Azohydromonas australica]|uniref:NAD-binding protein n=1 Tax=Azohydromonas australica TaxID=364039 RepID=UPI001B7F9691